MLWAVKIQAAMRAAQGCPIAMHNKIPSSPTMTQVHPQAAVIHLHDSLCANVGLDLLPVSVVELQCSYELYVFLLGPSLSLLGKNIWLP
jgi:hypothetical protein